VSARQRFATVALGGLAGVVASAGMLAVTAAAFALSFDAIRFTAQAAHIRPGLAWLFPVSVDGAMAVAVVAAVVLRRLGRSAAYPWLVVLFGALVSIVANALHAWVAGGAVALPAAWAMALSAVPPVLLALSVHLLVLLALSVLPAEVAGPVPDSPAELTAPVPDTKPAPRQARNRSRRPAPAAERVARAAARKPAATAAELAAAARVSERTARRYLAGQVATPVPAPNGRRHGDVPELEPVSP